MQTVILCGGRGMRPVEQIGDLDEAFERATSEAQKALGSGELYIRELGDNIQK